MTQNGLIYQNWSFYFIYHSNGYVGKDGRGRALIHIQYYHDQIN